MRKPTPFKGYDSNKTGTTANNFALGARRYNGTGSSPQAGKGGINLAGFNLREAKARTKRKLMMQQLKGGK